MAVAEFFGAEVVWVSEVEKPLLDRYTVPNLGDVTKVDWSEVEPVDILCGGYPCQPFSAAGRRGGFEDARDLWPAFARAIRILRPRFVIAENVAGHLQFGFDRTLCDLAEMGFDARWGVVRASEAGAPHRRERVFLLAYPTSERGPGESGELDERGALVGSVASSGRGTGRGDTAAGIRVLGRSAGRQQAPQDAASYQGWGLNREPIRATSDPTRSGSQTRRSNGLRDGAESVVGLVAPSGQSFDFGPYELAIRRWERVVNRPAPSPIDERKRLTAEFVEWMMGFDAGHTDGLSRTQALKALGNAVVPQQAYLALELLCA